MALLFEKNLHDTFGSLSAPFYDYHEFSTIRPCGNSVWLGVFDTLVPKNYRSGPLCMSETWYDENISTLTLQVWFCWPEQTCGHLNSDFDNATGGYLADFSAQRNSSK